jgi:hypothetical protein
MVSNINNMCRLHNRDKGKMATMMGSCLDRKWWMTLSLLVHSVLNDRSPRKFLVHCIPQEFFWFIAFIERLFGSLHSHLLFLVQGTAIESDMNQRGLI